MVREYHKRARIHLPNAKIHAAVHVVVENQLALGDEVPAVQRAARRLMEEGLDRHDAIHAIANVLTDLMFDLFSGNSTYTDLNEPYAAGLDRLTAQKWLEGK